MTTDRVFRFKRFSVSDTRSAMKIGTDGVLLGAWCRAEGARRVLDVGTGAGVIALMVAQRQPMAQVDAVEIDLDSCQEAELNFASSPWSGRLRAIHADFNQFAAQCQERYDLIVSNPPFFTNGALPPAARRMAARHCVSLNYSQLIGGASRLMAEGGRICLIAPHDADALVTAAAEESRLCPARRIDVFPKPGAPAIRTLWELSAENRGTESGTLTIESDIPGQFSAPYVALTGAFYLNM